MQVALAARALQWQVIEFRSACSGFDAAVSDHPNAASVFCMQHVSSAAGDGIHNVLFLWVWSHVAYMLKQLKRLETDLRSHNQWHGMTQAFSSQSKAWHGGLGIAQHSVRVVFVLSSS